MKRLLSSLLFVSLTASHFNTAAAEKMLLEWTFDQASNLQGWQPNPHVTNATVAGGAITCRTVGNDPMFILGPLLNLPTSPWQAIEVRLKADRAGGAEFFWSGTTQGPFGGLSQEKTTDFHVIGDNQWHVYRLFPFWHPEKKIVKLRLDLFDAASFTIDSIRIVELSVPPAVAKADFDFTKGLQGWQAIGNATLATSTGSVSLSAKDSEAFALAPPVNINADTDSYVSLRLAVDRGDHATLVYATDRKHGLHTFTFRVTPDGQEHTYNVDMLNAPNWNGRVLALGLRPSEAAGATGRVRWLKVSPEPQGAPQLRVVSFALEDALPRVSVPVTLAAIVANTGGEALKNLRTQLELPKGLQVRSDSVAKPLVPALGFSEETRFEFKVQASEALKGEAVLRFTADNLQPVVVRAPVVFTSRAQTQKADYVPVPTPVRGPTEVGVYYFPGWNSMSRWQPIQGFPERKPVLGWYREGDPEVADWHIKWAVEHGITYFAYDWYWSKGSRHLEHGLHDGYFKARYRHLLKFCLLWANHNPPRTSSHEDCLAVTRYWIENYFRRPEHLTIDGKPVMIIFSTHRLTDDLGSAGVKKAFDAMREECRKAGLKGLYFIACVGSAGQAKHAAEEGYDAVSAYNWPGLGLSAGEKRAPFATLPDAYRRNWEHILAECPIPLVLPVSGGWDSRPWHGDGKLVRYDRTPELFKRHLLDAQQFIASQGAPLPRLASTLSPSEGLKGQPDKLKKRVPLPNHVLIEAWNEWGEGSYIEPHNEFGFGYLDAIREVFTGAPKSHVDLTPADVGRGPYDLPPPPPPQTAWDFAQGDEGWNNTMHLADVKAKDGALTGRTTGRDPAFFSSGLEARASEFGTVVIRMKLQSKDGKPFKDGAQLFWRTKRIPESEGTTVRFEVNADGQWHDYTLPVGQNRRWNGLVTRLRLDPCNRPDVLVAIDSVKLQR